MLLSCIRCHSAVHHESKKEENYQKMKADVERKLKKRSQIIDQNLSEAEKEKSLEKKKKKSW